MRLAHDDVVSVLGPVDETVVADIVATGVTPEELAEARAWVNADEAMIGEGRPLPSGRLAKLVELLQSDQDEP